MNSALNLYDARERILYIMPALKKHDTIYDEVNSLAASGFDKDRCTSVLINLLKKIKLESPNRYKKSIRLFVSLDYNDSVRVISLIETFMCVIINK